MKLDDARMKFDDATALAEAVQRGQLSAVQALEATLARIASEGPALNAVASLQPDVGLRHAQAVDEALARCADDAARLALRRQRPFLGVPLLLKDIGAAAVDLPSRLGTRIRFGGDGLRWPVDSTLVARYRAAGFVPFGRTTSPEMGISPSTEARTYGGPTRNPYGLAFSAGGSSGGAAAAVAGGLVTIAHANDGAGSIRIPASCCGLVGLKPSRGLLPMGPLAGEGWGGLAVEHMLTRSVRDCAIALDACAGADEGAPYAAPMPPGRFADALADAQQAPRRRIALCDRFFEGDAVHPEVRAATRQFAQRLEALGHTVVEAGPPIATLELLQPVVHIVACGTAMAVDGLVRQLGRPLAADELEPVTWSACELGRRVSGADYLRAVADMHALGRRVARWFADWDALLTPTLAEPPAELGRFAMGRGDYLDYRLGPDGVWRYSPFTPLANATGGASISLPAGRSAAGLPIGAMLTAGLGDDSMLLQLAAELEAA